MKLKLLVMMSSIVLLAFFIVCVSTYAYNAYCSMAYNHLTGVLKMNAAMNNHGLVNGNYVIHVKVTAPGTTRASSYGTQQLSRSLTATGSGSNGGYASAFVNGYDAIGQYCSDNDSRTWP